MKIDNDLLYAEDEIRTTDRLILDNSQAIDLAVFGYIHHNGRTLYRRKRFDSRLQADRELQTGEVIAETRTAAFILTPLHRKCIPSTQSLSL